VYINMAAGGRLVLCAPLCFLLSRINRIREIELKTALLGFYNPPEISYAKRQLKEDVEAMKLTAKLPRIANRQGNDKTAREIDDIVVLVTFLDQQAALDKLPRYVSDSPDTMPYFRLVDGDFRYFF